MTLPLGPLGAADAQAASSPRSRLAAGALPQVEPGALPRHVREAGPDAISTYRAALGFERSLLVELLRPLGQSASGGEDGEGDAGAGAYGDLVPQTLADALAARGGVGLADELYRSLREDGSR